MTPCNRTSKTEVTLTLSGSAATRRKTATVILGVSDNAVLTLVMAKEPSEPSFPGRGILDRAERMVGVPLAAVTNSPQFGVALVLIQRADRAVRRPIDSLTARGLHLMNAPSHDDVRDLKRELAEVHRDLASLRRDLRAGDGRKR